VIELRWLIVVKLCHMMGIVFDFIIKVPKFGVPPQKKLGPKTCKIGTISDIFRVRSRISSQSMEISKN